MTARILVAGLGNIFLGDDGFGAEVARRLAAMGMPDGVRVADYGTSGMHLAYDLANGYDMTILIDAAPRGGDPGTITVLEVGGEQQRDLAAAGGALRGSRLFDGHGMQPDIVLDVLGMLGGEPGRVLVVGCQPASLEPGIGLSEPVQAAVGEAARIVHDLITAGPAAGPAAKAARQAETERGPAMCLGIPGQVIEFLPEQPDLAKVDVSGVRRVINVGLLTDSPPQPGEWVLIHVGFALSKIDEKEAAAALEFLEGIGQAYADELAALAESRIE